MTEAGGLKPLRVGMVGMNAGNGHPFSFAAILNGYEPDLMRAGPFPVIAEYLAREAPEAFGIAGVRVTSIWAREANLARQVARTCRIPEVVHDHREMLGNVDAVILPTDDASTHLDLARPFLEAGIPTFIDKPLSDSVAGARMLFRLAEPRGLLMSCSALRYSEEVQALKQLLDEIGPIRLVHGVSWRSWEAYGVHLAEAVDVLFDRPASEVRHIGTHRHAVVYARYDDGPEVVYNIYEDIGPILQLAVYGERGFRVVEFSNWFFMFKYTLARFVDMIRLEKPPISPRHTLRIISVVAGAKASLENGGAAVPISDADSVWP